MKRLLILAMMVLALAGCRHEKQQAEHEYTMLQRLEASAYAHPDDRMLFILDSLLAAGEATQAEADYARGIVNDVNRHIQLAEHYYTKSYEALKPERDGWKDYLTVATRLSQIRMTLGDFNGSLEVANTAMEKARAAGELDDYNESTFLWSIAACQRSLNIPESEETARRVSELLLKQAAARGQEASVNELIFSTSTLNHYLRKGDIAKADSVLRRCGESLKILDTPGNEDLIKEYRRHLLQSKITLLEEQDKYDEAIDLFRKSLPEMKKDPDASAWAASHLLYMGHAAEAADLYDSADAMLPDDDRTKVVNLNSIGYILVPRLRANLAAGRTKKVLAIADTIARNYNRALAEDRENNAMEQAIIYDTQGKEMQIAQQQARLTRQRLLGTGIALVLLSVFFLVYTWYRRRAQHRLSIAHEKLQEAYDQLEETTAAKERIESELRIARDIQMSMVPGVFPQREGLDMYAEMITAKEVGGDLYGYVLQGDNLYFCVGDVSGKGVPASLFMSQSARLFRTLATEGLNPVDIAVRMNRELSENNDRSMFVTMFIGMIHLDTGRMDYCNCGHNAPVLDSNFLHLEYTNAPLGLWEDDPFYGESIEDIRGSQLLVYTDGLNEAENAKQELFGNERLLQLMALTRSLDSREVIDTIKKAVEKHRGGVEPNDDLTLMCLNIAR